MSDGQYNFVTQDTETTIYLMKMLILNSCSLLEFSYLYIRICAFLFYVSLTVRLSITLANEELDAQIFNIFITILYICMFLAISCSSSGGQIVLIQHLVSSLSVSDRPVHRTVTY
jgi:hypothetical protein